MPRQACGPARVLTDDERLTAGLAPRGVIERPIAAPGAVGGIGGPVGGSRQPVGVDLKAPAGRIRQRHCAIGDAEGIAEEQALLPGIVIRALDREFEILAALGIAFNRCMVAMVTSDRLALWGVTGRRHRRPSLRPRACG